MTADAELTATSLIAAASSVLESAGYSQVLPHRAPEWKVSGSRLYEDAYSIAAVIAYETWADLAANWLDAQTSLVDLISTYFVRAEAKASEGYLVLLTPSRIPVNAEADAREIQCDTTYVRKLVAAADELQTPSDIEYVLLPLLPLRPQELTRGEQSALDVLPELLERRDIDAGATRTLVNAFRNQDPLVEQLHRYLHSDRSKE